MCGDDKKAQEVTMLDIKQEIKDDVVLLRLKGTITIGTGDVFLRGVVKDLLEAGYQKILLDMQKVSSMDSAGMGELVAAYTTVKHKGGTMKLLNLPHRVLNLFEITQLITVFESFTDEKIALQSFKD